MTRTHVHVPIFDDVMDLRMLQGQRLCSLPLNNINDEVKQEVMNSFQVHGDEKVCRKCRTRITAFIRNKDKELSKTQLSSDTCTTSPSKHYTNASRATKKRMKATAKTLVKTVVDQCSEISKGDGWKSLQEVTVKTPLQHTIKTPTHEDCQNKISKVMDGLSQTNQKEAHGSSGKIKVLSTLAPHFKKKELKKAISCSDYEITEARKHAQQHGPGATANKPKQVRRFRIPPDDLAFVVNFIRHPDNTCRSSHRKANCEGKRSSWISDLLDQEQQPVMG